MKRVPDLSLVLACFNERDVFIKSVASIVDVLDGMERPYEIIFVDDLSTDGTQNLIHRALKKYPYTKAFFHQTNQGRGKTVSDGIEASSGMVVGFMDIDCEVAPDYIPRITSMILQKKADVVIGKRIYRTTPGSIIREILSRGYQWLSNIMIGTGGMDTETGYKFFDRKQILPILAETKNHGWFWDTEIMVRAKRAKLSILELPVLFVRRFDKTSSVHLVKDTLEYLRNLWRFRMVLQAEQS